MLSCSSSSKYIHRPVAFVILCSYNQSACGVLGYRYTTWIKISIHDSGPLAAANCAFMLHTLNNKKIHYHVDTIIDICYFGKRDSLGHKSTPPTRRILVCKISYTEDVATFWLSTNHVVTPSSSNQFSPPRDRRNTTDGNGKAISDKGLAWGFASILHMPIGQMLSDTLSSCV